MLLQSLSRSCSSQWPSWNLVRCLASHVVVSAEAAKAVSQHGHGLVKMPGDVLQTLEEYIQDVGLSGKVSKQQALALTEKLKALSRSTAVGGLQPYRTHPAAGAGAGSSTAHRLQPELMTAEQLQEQQEMDAEMEQMACTLGPEVLAQYRATRQAAAAAAKLPLPRTKGGRLKASALSALEAHISTHGVLGLPHEAVRAAFGLPPSSSLMSSSKGEALQQATPKYNNTQALAYALSRLPGCYAAAHRIFKELSVRYPALKPKTLMDFGAGPGTATWAAQEVWPSCLSRVTAVEPSAAMSQLGRRLEAARRFAHPHAPLVRWRPDLPPVELSGRKKQQQQQRRHDIVVASYVLGELPSQQERAALVRQLWGLTGDLLVLIEPGTPAGFANILEARSGILQYEGRRTDKLQRRLAAASSNGSGSSSSSSSSQCPDPSLPAKAGSKWFGAHVVAPCPHDAPCPLAAPGSTSWCHFGTRFHRPGFMQQAKAPTGSRMNPSDHQDERYSYVVLRRGTRPLNIPELDIRRSFAPKAVTTSTPQTAINSLDAAPARASHSAADAAGRHWGTVEQSGSSPSAAGGASQLISGQELQHLSSLVAAGPQQQAPSMHGTGLINRLIALEDAGVDWSLPGSMDAADMDAVASVNQDPDGFQQDGEAVVMVEQLEDGLDPVTYMQHPTDAPRMEMEYDLDQDLESADTQGFADAATSSAVWSRIIRPPRKRGGHVILDVCAAYRGPSPAVDADSKESSNAAIVRHVIARSDCMKRIGPAGYAMARSACWGDLWPAAYNHNQKQHVIS